MVLVTAVGIAFRLARLDETLIGDELSTLFIVDGNDLGNVFTSVSSDAEISPPLYFILSWLTTKLGSAPELVRLPSLLAGVASIPLTYAVGARAVGRGAGLIAAAVMALSPFMIFYSTDGRAYAVAIFLLLVSTLAMLHAVEDGRVRWWVVYGAATCLAMYSHYTAAFVLGAQLIWLLWAHPQARRPALLANLAAAVLFIPWIPSLIADMDSPTVEILEVLQGEGLGDKVEAVEAWMIGLPYVSLSQVPSQAALVVALVALGLGIVWGLVRWWRSAPGRPQPSKGVLLVVALCLATPVAEALLLNLGGTDLFSARNLNASSAGLALTIGAVLASAGPAIGAILTIAVIGSYSVAAVRILDPDHQLVGTKTAAEFIDAEAASSDVVVDAVTFTPVPLTPLDTALPQTRREYRLNLPEGDPPFLPLKNTIPDTADVLPEAFAAASGNRLFLVARSQVLPPSAEHPNGAIRIAAGRSDDFGPAYPLPEGVSVVGTEPVPGYLDATITIFEVR